MASPWRLLSHLWLMFAEWRRHPARLAMALCTIAIGVALGYAVQLINATAYAAFSSAARSVSGAADAQVRGGEATIDDAWYGRIARLPEVAIASPVLALNATVLGRMGSADAGDTAALPILGIDVFQAAQITPDLMGVPDASRPLDTLSSDAIFLSAAAQAAWHVRVGDRLRIQVGTTERTLRVAGGLRAARAGQRLGVMDIAAAQWRFDAIGKISRIDIRLQANADLGQFTKSVKQLGMNHHGGSQLLVSVPGDADSRADRLSRAYRVNMNMLALVALFTGAYFVFATQFASVVRRRGALALVRVLGMTRRQLVMQMLCEGATLGVVGSVIGLCLGYGLALGVVSVFGGDLGGGYFSHDVPHIGFEPGAAAIFAALGLAVSLIASALPGIEASRTGAAVALKPGSEETALSRLRSPWPALICLVLASILVWLPPLFGMPLAAYLAVACLLIGGIALLPRANAWVFGCVSRSLSQGIDEHGDIDKKNATRNRVRGHRSAILILAVGRLANAPGLGSIAMGGVSASFALIVAMAVMVGSFRVSVDDWLRHLLSSDLYVSAQSSGDTGGLDATAQARIAAVNGVRHAAFSRATRISLEPSRPDVAVLARQIDISDPGADMQMMSAMSGAALTSALQTPRTVAVWVSEAMVDLYGYRLGQAVHLPIGRSGAVQQENDFIVAGIWRDYVRQTGAIQMRLSDYRRLTGDTLATDVAIDVGSNSKADSKADSTADGGERNVDAVIESLRQLPFGALLHFARPGEIRARTLTIFDRSFAVTYLLEAVAMVIGLFGVAATFSAQALARAREFGMLRHIGVTRAQIVSIMAAESIGLTVIGLAMGGVLGFAVSLILVFVVNPQSFHWSMSLHIPWHLLFVMMLAMLFAATLTAMLAAQRAVSVDAVRAVKEDW